MNNNDIVITKLAGYSHMSCHFFELLYPALALSIASSLNIDVTRVAEAGLLLYLLLGFLAIFWGIIGDKLGNKNTLLIGLFITGAASILSSFSTTINELFYTQALVGLGISATHPCGMGMITKRFEKKGKALATYGVYGSFGLMSGPIVGGLIGQYYGWSIAMRVTGVICVLLSLYFTFSLRNLSKVESEHSIKPKESTSKNNNFHSFLILLICMTLVGIVYRANMVNLPIVLPEKASSLVQWANGISSSIFGKLGTLNPKVGATGLILSIGVFFGIFGQKLGGYVADKYNLKYSYTAFFALALIPLVFIDFTTEFSFVFLCTLFMFFSLGMQPIENSLVALFTPEKVRSTAYGFKFILNFGIGSSGVWIVSKLKPLSPTGGIYIILSVLILVHIIFSLVLIRVSRERG